VKIDEKVFKVKGQSQGHMCTSVQML